MKKIAIVLCGALGLLVASQATQAQGPATYSGQQPWWNIFARRQKLNPEEEKLQHFWHDYYDSMGRYYQTLEHIDWVTYYKNHGYQINTGGGPGCSTGCGPCGGPNRIQFAPVFVTPGMQWAVPNSTVNGPPSGPMNPPASVYTQGGPPMSYGPPPGPPYNFGPPGGNMGGFGPPGGGFGPPQMGPPGGPMGGPPMGGPPMGGPPMGGPPMGPQFGGGFPPMGPGGPPMMGPGGPPMMGPGGPPMMGPGGPQTGYNYNQFNGNVGAPVTQAAYNYGYNYAPVSQAAYNNYGVAPAFANGYDVNTQPAYGNYGGNYGPATAFASGYDANSQPAGNGGSNFGTAPGGFVGNGFVGYGFNGYHCDGCPSEGCPANQVCYDPYPTR